MVLFAFSLMLVGVLFMLLASGFVDRSVKSALKPNRSEVDIKKAAADAAGAVVWLVTSLFALGTSMLILMHKFS